MENKLIHISFSGLYLYKGVTLEWHEYLGPTVLNRATEKERPWRGISNRTWGLVGQFSRLSKQEKEQYII